MEVPVSVTVYDYTLKDEIHSRSLFGMHIYWNEGGIAAGEKDSSWEMFGKYYDYLLDYRICGRTLPAAAGDVETFIEQLKYLRQGLARHQHHPSLYRKIRFKIRRNGH